MNLGEAIADVRKIISDPATTSHPEGKRFTNAQITRWINAGIELAYNFRKDLFMQTSIVKATPGDLQQPPGFEKIKSVDALTDACGSVIKPLKKVNNSLAGLFKARGCNGRKVPKPGEDVDCSSITPDHVSNGITNGQFYFTPPVCAGSDVFYRVTGTVRPTPVDCDLDNDLCFNASIMEPALHYARYLAWLTETESQTSQTLAMGQINLMFTMLRVYKAEDQKFCQEFCKEDK
jgi:hypothetical protein